MAIGRDYKGVAIGITGRKRAGKTTVVDFLKESGFKVRSTREAVMRYIAEDPNRGDPNDTKNQQFWGNEARRLNFGDVWMAMLLEAPIIGDVIFDSPRYPDQDSILRHYFRGKYMLLAIDMHPSRRLELTLRSTRPGDPRTAEEFFEADRRDWNGYRRGDGQDVEGCFQVADVTIQNNGTIEQLKSNVLRTIADFRRKVYG